MRPLVRSSQNAPLHGRFHALERAAAHLLSSRFFKCELLIQGGSTKPSLICRPTLPSNSDGVP